MKRHSTLATLLTWTVIGLSATGFRFIPIEAGSSGPSLIPPRRAMILRELLPLFLNGKAATLTTPTIMVAVPIWGLRQIGPPHTG